VGLARFPAKPSLVRSRADDRQAVESCPVTNHGVAHTFISTSLRTTGLSLLRTASLLAVALREAWTSRPNCFIVCLATCFGSRDAEVGRLSGSHHEFQIPTGDSLFHGVMHVMAAHFLLKQVTLAQ
jgi:hypothetical protein